MNSSRKKLIFLELNEVNFDIAKNYIVPLSLVNFGRLFGLGVRRTISEVNYEELEPWIQWVSAHSGLTSAEHGVFRLGDIISSDVPQIFEKVEFAGLTVGAISPMNAANRLKSPAYFIPDPWTYTPTDGSAWSRRLWAALSQVVNDNASGRITLTSVAVLLAGLLRFARPRHYALYLKLALGSIKYSWRRALLLDLFLHDVHMNLRGRHSPNFSTLFLNAGAHIQHHYLFNARLVPASPYRNPKWYLDPVVDPFGEMLQVYDVILGDYIDMPHTSLLVATGLTQQPYDRVKFYWRLRNHDDFLRAIGLRFLRVMPRMTRDFLIDFESIEDARSGEELLSSLTMADEGTSIFGEIENRGRSLFVTLTYPREIRPKMFCVGPFGNFDLFPYVVFVAIKNGMHATHGFVVGRGDVSSMLPADGDHIKSVYYTIMRYFGIQ